MLSPPVQQAVGRYLGFLDRLLGDPVSGFYIVGSVALGAYRPRRSDIDFVAVLSPERSRPQARRLRVAQVESGLSTAVTAARQRRSPLTGTLNGVFIQEDDLPTPVTEIVPVASQVGARFFVGRAGSDVSPVAWKVLAEKGVTWRGSEPALLGLDPQPHLLRSWTAGNLESYWRPWAARLTRRSHRGFAFRPRWSTAWGVLGVSRLYCTIATGEVVSKEAAGRYALSHFDHRWRSLIAEALAYWREEPDQLGLPWGRRAELTAAFVEDVIDGGLREHRRSSDP
jgi:Domain of unknown function (DUF4111)/Nucleotidyltransferase domain